jgi:hypothetical protein
MPDPFVIKIRYGGLGDHLFYSHLPRIAKETGAADRVYISNLSEYRSADYKELVWAMNPYVDGFVDEDAPYPEFDQVEPGTNLLDRIMLERGLDDGLRHHEPEVYYRPTLLPDYVSAYVYDPNYVSYVGNASAEKITYQLRRDLRHVIQLQPREKSLPLTSHPPLLTTQSFWHYCDIICSCKRFYCLTSGGATLAAALHRPATVFHGAGQNTMFHHSHLHRYCDVSPETALPNPSDFPIL